MADYKSELEEIFNVASDGSNIKDADEDDDNGYSGLANDGVRTFGDKASELAEKLTKVEPTTELPRAKEEAPKPAPDPAPVAPPQPAKAEPKQADAIDELLKDSIAKPTPVSQPQEAVVTPPPPPPAETSSDLGDDLGVEQPAQGHILPPETFPAEPPTMTLKDIKAERFPIIDKDSIERKAAEETPNVFKPVVDQQPVADQPRDDMEADAVAEKALEVAPQPVAEPPLEKSKKKVKSKAENADTEDGPNQSHESGQADEDGWVFFAPVPSQQWFYIEKRRLIQLMLVGGKLPFDKYHEELVEFSTSVNVSFDLKEMYEKMVELQGYKDRVREIQIQANDQFFIFERMLDCLRADAARMEDTKVALVDAAARKHLWDFEAYFGRLKALVKNCEGVMRNLDSAMDTVSRGVTIALPDRSFERYGKQFEHREVESKSTWSQQNQSSHENVSPVSRNSTSYDSIDTPAAKKPSVIPEDDPWSSVGVPSKKTTR